MSAPGWLALVNREDWQDDAMCRQVDVGEVFFPDKGGSTREAKLICRNCPVRLACLDYAIRTEEPHGVWGGHSERERHRIRRGEVVPFRITGEREIPINECAECGSPFKDSRGKYCGEKCRNEVARRYRQKRYQAAMEGHAARKKRAG